MFKAHAGARHDIDFIAGYEVEEILTLATALTLSATAVSRAEVGFISDQLESVALRQALAGATSKYADNVVIHALFGHHLKRRTFLKAASSYNTLDDVLEKAIARIRQALAILTEKATPEELRDYKELVYYCCDRVARASGSSLIDQQLISPEEEAVLETIEAALNLSYV